MSVGQIIAMLLKLLPDIAKTIKEIIDLFKGKPQFSSAVAAASFSQEDADLVKGKLDELKAKVDGLVKA